MMKKNNDFIGYSEKSIDEAIDNALKKAGDHSRYELIETVGAQVKTEKKQYKVTLKTFAD